MVKVVDNFILERMIGKGQYGEVYKGYNKITSIDVAIKAVNRKNLKGKFYELLENEIKVLRSCHNENIIELYDIRKTSNNIYLMIEYCNEGDLMQYLKKRGKLTEEETIEFVVQILNGFKSLIKNNIMHRDFKLANILKHNGVIKIADFGFAKILTDDAFASTMLGSPLNMAPEILGAKDYNNKADIWSIGTCIYELLFGRPPYTAKNIVELLQKIKSTPFSLPHNVKLNPVLEDLLMRMLIFNPDHRIEWEDLFNHKITRMMEEKIQRELEETINANDIKNISKFYIKNNKVIDHVIDIDRKQEYNEYAYKAVISQKPQEKIANGTEERQKIPGPSAEEDLAPHQENKRPKNLARQTQEMRKTGSIPRQNNDQKKLEAKKADPRKTSDLIVHETKKPETSYPQSQENLGQEPQEYVVKKAILEPTNGVMTNMETEGEILVKIYKLNSSRILHERNKYVFIAAVAEDAGTLDFKGSDLIGYILIKKLFKMLCLIKGCLEEKKNLFKLDKWESYLSTKDFKKIGTYISKEFTLFKNYYDGLNQNIMKKYKANDNKNQIYNRLINASADEEINHMIRLLLKDYVGSIYNTVERETLQQRKDIWIHLNQLLDCLNSEKIFYFQRNSNEQFNFKLFYEDIKSMKTSQVIEMVQKKLKQEAI